MKTLVEDFGNLIRSIIAQDHISQEKPYSIHDTQGLLVLAQKDQGKYYELVNILITAEELNLYAKSQQVEPRKLLYDIMYNLSMNGDDTNALNKERFDKEKILIYVEKKKAANDMFGVAEFMFNAAHIKFRHHEFFYLIVMKKQKKQLHKGGPKTFTPRPGNGNQNDKKHFRRPDKPSKHNNHQRSAKRG